MAIALGSNLGDSRRILAQALDRLEEALGPLLSAPLYLTEPVSPIPQAPFLNTVAVGRTGLAAEQLLALTQRIEAEFGRERRIPDAPRTLDLDILLLGDEIRSVAPPLVPHPRLRSRRFVLAPLADVAPDWAIPPGGETPRELLQELPEAPWARRIPGSFRDELEADPRIPPDPRPAP